MATEDTSLNHLPKDILQAILSRLPVKTLLTLRSVSKSWNTMISDPSFVRMHLQRQHNYLFLHISSNPSNKNIMDRFSLVSVMSGDARFQIESKLECPRPGWHTVLCTCQGVVLLTDYSRNTFMLWNPSARTETMLWFPYRFDCWWAKHGLCHDPTTGDFKVVVTSKKYYAVYSCKNKSWTKRRDFRYNSCQFDTDTGIFVDGVIYWVAYKSREIIYFDPRDDEFKNLQTPENISKGISDRLFYLVRLGDCLCLYCHTRSDKTAVQIWIKEKGRDRNTWNELMMIEYEEKPDEWFRPMCLFEYNKILLQLDKWGRRFVVYSAFEKTFEEFGEINDSSVKLVPCRESLLFPLENLRRPKRKRSEPLKLKE